MLTSKFLNTFPAGKSRVVATSTWLKVNKLRCVQDGLRRSSSKKDIASNPFFSNSFDEEHFPTTTNSGYNSNNSNGNGYSALSKSDFYKFVKFFRQASPYIEGHRGRIFIIVIPGNVSSNRELLQSIMNDISLLHGLGCKLVIVVGSQHQIDATLHERNQVPQYMGGYRVTNKDTLKIAIESAGNIRVACEQFLSKGPTIPMFRRHTKGDCEIHFEPAMRVVSGNYVTAKRRGVIDGVDFLYTGEVRFVLKEDITRQLDASNIVLLSNIGFTAAGEVLNCNTHDVGLHAAIELGADKLFFLHQDEVTRLELPQWLPLPAAQNMLLEKLQASISQAKYDALKATLDQYNSTSGRRDKGQAPSLLSFGKGKKLDIYPSLGLSHSLLTDEYGNTGDDDEDGGRDPLQAQKVDFSSSSGGGVSSSRGSNGLNKGGSGSSSCCCSSGAGAGAGSGNDAGASYGAAAGPGADEGGAGNELPKPSLARDPYLYQRQLQHMYSGMKKDELVVNLDIWTAQGFPTAVSTCVIACCKGVRRAHLLDARQDGGLLLELYSRDGVGTMISADFYEGIRKARYTDLYGIQQLLEPLERDGILVHRSREDLIGLLPSFTVIERDNRILGCALLLELGRTPDGASVAELGAFCVDNTFRGTGRGDSLLDYVEQGARQHSIQRLVLLTTRTADWFEQRDFRWNGPAYSSELLPEPRRSKINPARNSQLYVKELASLEGLDVAPGKRIGY